MAQLHAVQGQDIGRRWEIPEGEVSVGRDPSCEIVLTDARVSRRHCRIEYVAGFYLLTNLSKTNGTQVNRIPIEERQLEDKDEIALGATVLRFVAVEETATKVRATAIGPKILDPTRSVIFYGGADAEAAGERVSLKCETGKFSLEPAAGDAERTEQIESYARRFEIIRDVVDSVVTELNLDKVFERILDHVFNCLNAERGCVLIYDPARGQCVPRAVRQRGDAARTEGFPMSRTICEMALREKVAVLSTDAMRDERFSSRDSVILQGLRSVMSAPMIFQNRPLGIISVDNRDLSSAFSKQDLETLTIIANLAATAIHNAQMVRDHVRMEVTRQNFARFLPPALVRQVTEQGRELRLGGQKAEVTVLFTDIRAFTSMCASRPAEEIVNLLNVYFHELTECVFRHQGTLDKYLGDGILAVFGCPEPHADHSARAARAAVEMRDILTTHDLLRRQIGVGIALHRGEVIHGFVGSRQRIQYTVVGDTVNTASRLCGQAKAGQILISRAVLDTAGEYLETRPLAPVALEGKTEPLPCYEIVGLSDKGKAFRADVTPWRGETERHPTN